MAIQPYFDAALFAFLEALHSNNNREWFQAHKQGYERDVRGPMLRFIGDVGPYLWQLSPRFVADARPNGCSLFRIHRDVRFAQDKRPYKTHAGLSFRHADGRDVHAPVFYLHLEPGSVFAAAGMWRPPAESVKLVRDAIVAHPERWKRATRTCPLGEPGDGLQRTPRGYDPEHPLVADLKRQSFITTTSFTEKEAGAPDFLDRFAQASSSVKLVLVMKLWRFRSSTRGCPGS